MPLRILMNWSRASPRCRSPAQLPVVQETGPDAFTLIAGECQIRAVTAAGWQTVACLVYRHLDAATAHTLRVVENLHHRPLQFY
jgi:ParB-like chromosome segregation protein Spo0J